jgi:hypothetical protein
MLRTSTLNKIVYLVYPQAFKLYQSITLSLLIISYGRLVDWSTILSTFLVN